MRKSGGKILNPRIPRENQGKSGSWLKKCACDAQTRTETSNLIAITSMNKRTPGLMQRLVMRKQELPEHPDARPSPKALAVPVLCNQDSEERSDSRGKQREKKRKNRFAPSSHPVYTRMPGAYRMHPARLSSCLKSSFGCETGTGHDTASRTCYGSADSALDS